MIVVIMGVAGSGKTTIGTLLADALRCEYLEGDSLHSPANVEKMSRGIPLTDADRASWLAVIRARLLDAFERGMDLVVGCSALKESYRAFLADQLPVSWVFLKGSAELIGSRLRQRSNHFLTVEMLPSQIEALEEPRDAIVADVSQPPSAIVEQILAELRRRIELRE